MCIDWLASRGPQARQHVVGNLDRGHLIANDDGDLSESAYRFTEARATLEHFFADA